MLTSSACDFFDIGKCALNNSGCNAILHNSRIECWQLWQLALMASKPNSASYEMASCTSDPHCEMSHHDTSSFPNLAH
eukprot:6455429-Amphidinium_carterae.2